MSVAYLTVFGEDYRGFDPAGITNRLIASLREASQAGKFLRLILTPSDLRDEADPINPEPHDVRGSFELIQRPHKVVYRREDGTELVLKSSHD